jgi:multidrug efflux pump subunit AcrA (membrane-fusion protein)
MPNLNAEKRKMDQAAADLKKARANLKKALDRATDNHGKIEPRNAQTLSPPDKLLKAWNKDMQQANKALNEVAKALQKLSNATNAYHMARLNQEGEGSANTSMARNVKS